ncbi:MAG: PAS domain-containing protein [Stappiaceae bacterium]
MKHASTQALYAYWNSLRNDRPAPERQEIEPSDIRRLLGDTFILEAMGSDKFIYRLAGTRLCSLYCRELKGRDFLTGWEGKDSNAIATMLNAVSQEAAAAVVGIDGLNLRKKSVPLEMILLPLEVHGEGYKRILGTCVPMSQPYWMGIHPLTNLSISSLRLIWPDERPHYYKERSGQSAEIDLVDRSLSGSAIPPIPTDMEPAVPDNARKIAHLVVYDGGRAD